MENALHVFVYIFVHMSLLIRKQKKKRNKFRNLATNKKHSLQFTSRYCESVHSPERTQAYLATSLDYSYSYSTSVEIVYIAMWKANLYSILVPVYSDLKLSYYI